MIIVFILHFFFCTVEWQKCQFILNILQTNSVCRKWKQKIDQKLNRYCAHWKCFNTFEIKMINHNFACNWFNVMKFWCSQGVFLSFLPLMMKTINNQEFQRNSCKLIFRETQEKNTRNVIKNSQILLSTS